MGENTKKLYSVAIMSILAISVVTVLSFQQTGELNLLLGLSVDISYIDGGTDTEVTPNFVGIFQPDLSVKRLDREVNYFDMNVILRSNNDISGTFEGTVKVYLDNTLLETYVINTDVVINGGVDKKISVGSIQSSVIEELFETDIQSESDLKIQVDSESRISTGTDIYYFNGQSMTVPISVDTGVTVIDDPVTPPAEDPEDPPVEDPVDTEITLIQTASGRAYSENTVISMTSAPTEGNVLIMVTGQWGDYINGISQTGVTWTKAVGDDLYGSLSEIWYGVVGSSASSSLTVNYANNWFGGVVMEYSGIDTADPLDVTASHVGFIRDVNQTATETGTTVTTTQANQLWIGGVMCYRGATSVQTSPTNGFSPVLYYETTTSDIAVLSKTVDTTGTAYTGTTATTTESEILHVGVIATFNGVS